MYKNKGSFDLGGGYIITNYTFEIKGVSEGFTEVWLYDAEKDLTSSRSFESENILELEIFKNSELI